MIPIIMFADMIDDPDKLKLFNHLYETYKMMVIKTAFSITDDADLAEETAQETFLKVAMYIDTYNGSEEENAARLFTMAKNCSYIIVRREQRAESGRPAYRMKTYDENVPDNKSVENDAITSATLDDIVKMVQQLPEYLRDTFVLFYLEGMSINQVSAELGVESRTAKKRLQRVRTFIAARCDGDVLS